MMLKKLFEIVAIFFENQFCYFSDLVSLVLVLCKQMYYCKVRALVEWLKQMTYEQEVACSIPDRVKNFTPYPRWRK